MPPSTVRVAPVTNELSSLAKNSMARATSSGVACRASGMSCSKSAAARSRSAPVAATSMRCWNSLSTGPGWMVFTRMPHGDAGYRVHSLFLAPGEPGRRAAGPPRRGDADVPGVGGAGVLRPVGGEPAEHQEGHRVGVSRCGHERGSGGVAAVHGEDLVQEDPQ